MKIVWGKFPTQFKIYAPSSSEKSAPVPAATKLSRIVLIDLAGFT